MSDLIVMTGRFIESVVCRDPSCKSIDCETWQLMQREGLSWYEACIQTAWAWQGYGPH